VLNGCEVRDELAQGCYTIVQWSVAAAVVPLSILFLRPVLKSWPVMGAELAIDNILPYFT